MTGPLRLRDFPAELRLKIFGQIATLPGVNMAPLLIALEGSRDDTMLREANEMWDKVTFILTDVTAIAISEKEAEKIAIPGTAVKDTPANGTVVAVPKKTAKDFRNKFKNLVIRCTNSGRYSFKFIVVETRTNADVPMHSSHGFLPPFRTCYLWRDHLSHGLCSITLDMSNDE